MTRLRLSRPKCGRTRGQKYLEPRTLVAIGLNPLWASDGQQMQYNSKTQQYRDKQTGVVYDLRGNPVQQ
jgi:hypothetical protein